LSASHFSNIPIPPPIGLPSLSPIFKRFPVELLQPNKKFILIYKT